ncbi:MAG: DUF58 domain-containing protein [Phototrophicaceae bacterium]
MQQVTGRFYTFLIVAFMMYLFANQTQVNWLYVTSALIAGVIPAAWWLNRSALRGVAVARQIIPTEAEADAPIHEDDLVEVVVTFSASQRTLAHVAFTERCPLIDPQSPAHTLNGFVPLLPARRQLDLRYTATVWQRGLQSFPPVTVNSRAPFGLFRRNGSLAVPSPVLVYPLVVPLERFAPLDRQPTAQITAMRAGLGNEVVGVRPYRAGDSPRHIHWRSVARTGQLVSKEFIEETQPGISLVFDRYLPPNISHHPKHNPFEWTIKAGVSVADYARKRRYPLYLHADPTDYAVPYGAVTWDALMQYTARIPARSVAGLANVLSAGGFRQFVAVIVTQPDLALVNPLVGLRYSGAQVFVIVPDPATFPVAGDPADALIGALQAADVEVIRLAWGNSSLSHTLL